MDYLDAVALYIETEEIEKTEINLIANDEELKQMKKELNTSFASVLKVDSASLDSENPNADKFLAAVKLNITNGKMNLLNKLNDASENEINLEEWAAMSVKDIMKAVKANKSSEKALDDDEGNEIEEVEIEEDESEEIEDETEEIEDEEESPKASKNKSNNGKAKGKK